MEQQQAPIQVTVNCTPAAATATVSQVQVADASAKVKKSRRRKNYKWTHKKKTTVKRQANAQTYRTGQNYLCYALMDGKDADKMGVFFKWTDCKNLIAQFAKPIYKGFHDQALATKWLACQRKKLLYAHLEPNMSFDSAPVKQPKLVVKNGLEMYADPDPVAKIPVAKAYPIPVSVSAVPVAVADRDFSPVAEMARLIASLPDDAIPPAPVCSSKTCPYMSGDIHVIRQALLRRLMQTGTITGVHKD